MLLSTRSIRHSHSKPTKPDPLRSRRPSSTIPACPIGARISAACASRLDAMRRLSRPQRFTRFVLCISSYLYRGRFREPGALIVSLGGSRSGQRVLSQAVTRLPHGPAARACIEAARFVQPLREGPVDQYLPAVKSQRGWETKDGWHSCRVLRVLADGTIR